MIDLHCHLLPGIDDGAKDMEQAVAMARYAVSNGIEQVVITPHIQPGRFDNNRQSIQPLFEKLQAQLIQLKIDLKLHIGAEVHLSPEIMPMIDQGQIPFLGKLADDHVMLLELPQLHIPPGTERLIKWLADRQVRPLIAHPERNHQVSLNSDRLAPLIDLGALLQITSSSLCGRFGTAAKRSGEDLLKRGWVSVIATDAHNMRYRPPNLAAGREAAATIVGEAMAYKMVRDNPLTIIDGALTI